VWKEYKCNDLNYIIDGMDGKDSLLHSESKGQVIDLVLLRSWSVKPPSSAVSQCGCLIM